MNIKILCIGKLKEKYWTAAIGEYSKRLKPYCQICIEELKEARLPDKASSAEEQSVKEAEGEALLAHIRKTDYVITLEIQGKALSSEELAEKIQMLALDGNSQIVMVIGGSLGLSEAVSRRADFKLSFSKMTFPHQMIRVFLLEQIYRSFKIIKGEPYHK